MKKVSIFEIIGIIGLLVLLITGIVAGVAFNAVRWPNR